MTAVGVQAAVDNMLFSTLDPTIRKYTLPNNQNVLFVDTVGFIYKLPHNLIEAFKATLEEAVEADLLLHVLDVSHPKVREHADATYRVLEELHAQDKPSITVLNKSDKIHDEPLRNKLRKEFRDGIFISAFRKENIGELVERITSRLGSLTTLLTVTIPIKKMHLVHCIYEHGTVRKRIDTETNVYIEALVPHRVKDKITFSLTQGHDVIQ